MCTFRRASSVYTSSPSQVKPGVSSLGDGWWGMRRIRGSEPMRVALTVLQFILVLLFFPHVCVCLSLFEESGFNSLSLLKSSDSFSELLKNHFRHFFFLSYICLDCFEIILPFRDFSWKRNYLFPCFASSPKTLARVLIWTTINVDLREALASRRRWSLPPFSPPGGGEDHPSYRLLSGAKETLRRVIEWL